MPSKKPKKMKAKSTISRTKASSKVAPKVSIPKLIDPEPLPGVSAPKASIPKLIDPTPVP